jgi:hypothetical protein
MMSLDDLSRDRAETEATSVAIPCKVTAVDLTGEPRVTVQPLAGVPYDTFDGNVVIDDPLEVEEVPYVYASGLSFAFFIPPEVGMEGLYIVTDAEIGDIAKGEITSSRRKNPSSGYFIPSGRLTDPAFRASADWAEMRSDTCRVAMSRDTVHLQAGNTSLVMTASGFDVVVNGVSLIGAIKQLSDHIKALETLVHPNGMTHGGAHAHTIDDLSAATPPTRQETGVR